MLFVGSMDYEPNIDAVCWFVKHIRPRICQRIAAARLIVVGVNPVAGVRELHDGNRVIVTGTG